MTMPPLGRNAPCPCGSGRRYKNCHGAGPAASRPPEAAGSPLHELDRSLVERLQHYALRRFGERWLRAHDTFVDADRAVQLFRPWSVYHFPIDGQSAAEWLLADSSQSVSQEKRAWLEAQHRAWLSVWEVQGVTPGTAVTLNDRLTGETRTVLEALGSRQLVPGDAMLARVVDHAGISVLGGSHPQVLPPIEAALVVGSVRRRLRRKSSVPIDRLRGEAVERHLIASWEREILRMIEQARRQPELRNTDGDELLLTVDHFAVESGRRAELESLLAAVEELEPPEAGDPADTWTFVRPRDKTILGTVWLDKAGLRLETNSIARADRLRARLRDACGALLSHRAREHSSPFAPPGPARATGRIAPRNQIPEAEANRIVREFLDRHYADWPDHPLPALDGQTPRQAVRTAEGRERVRTLIKSFEHAAARGPAGPAPDFARLRRELGLLD